MEELSSIGDNLEFRQLMRNFEHKSLGLFEHRNAREELVSFLDKLLKDSHTSNKAEGK